MNSEEFFARLTDILNKQNDFFSVYGHLFHADTIAKVTHGMKAHEVAKVQLMFDQIHDYMDQDKSIVGSAYEHIRKNVLPEKMDEEGTASAKYDGIGRVDLRSDIYCKVLDAEALVTWLEQNDLDSIVKETVNASSLKAILRRRLQDGAAIPGDIIQITPFTMAVITKVKGNEK